MSNQIKHTPGPWRYHRVDSEFSITNDPSSFSGKLSFCIAITRKRDCDTSKEKIDWEKQDEANAKFIVTACNMHADLLAALEQIASDDRTPSCIAHLARKALNP